MGYITEETRQRIKCDYSPGCDEHRVAGKIKLASHDSNTTGYMKVVIWKLLQEYNLQLSSVTGKKNRPD